jgi:hypothetical protein
MRSDGAARSSERAASSIAVECTECADMPCLSMAEAVGQVLVGSAAF